MVSGENAWTNCNYITVVTLPELIFELTFSVWFDPLVCGIGLLADIVKVLTELLLLMVTVVLKFSELSQDEKLIGMTEIITRSVSLIRIPVFKKLYSQHCNIYYFWWELHPSCLIMVYNFIYFISDFVDPQF